MLYRSTDRLSRCGAPVKNLAHSASFHGMENIAPSNPGIKHLSFDADGFGGASAAVIAVFKGTIPTLTEADFSIV